ncbi:MAG: pirin family protein [Deltaproteobacteria bacterium]|nr:MAG: pirin family protein [Deltaproteobacteria bacterium]
MTHPVLTTIDLGPPPWPTLDPFLFCVHHLDHYPAGDERMAPKAALDGRNLGMDFAGKDGWRMYHGREVPGFPKHPHRGFETITLARRGFIDHSDSMGATARFGQGDVQWMTAGKGVEHCEMFPLVRQDQSNTGELFQLWLNLPRASKMVRPYFTMFWAPQVPRLRMTDAQDRTVEVVAVAGALEGAREAPKPPPDSWASDPKNHVAIWTISLSAGARWTLPGSAPGLNRVLYAFEGGEVEVAGKALRAPQAAQLRSEAEIGLVAGDAEVQLLMLQGRPINEPVVQHGPFVMNTRGEIRQAILDYQAGHFGDWPWGKADPVHPRTSGRFAIHADGRREEPG